MAERRENPERHVLPIGSENVRRRILDDAGEGTSGQHQPTSRPRVRDAGQRGAEKPPPVYVETPKKHRGILRGIRKRMGGLPQLGLDDYMKELDNVEREREHERGGMWGSSDSDITVDDSDNNADYVPPRE